MAMTSLTQEQRRALAAVADTFVQKIPEQQEREILSSASKPEDTEAIKAYLRTTASDLGVAEAVETMLMPRMRPDSRDKISLLLRLLSSCAGTSVLFGVCGPFADLSLEQRERAMQGLRDSCIGEKRKVFQQLQGMALLYTFNRDTAAVNPHNKGVEQCAMWKAIGYSGPEKKEAAEQITKVAGREEHIFTTLNSTITKDTELKFDAVIVGSGCGGGVVAAELAQAGHSVLVLEKGPYMKRAELTGEELQGFALLDGAGTMYTEDLRMAVLSASAFGGGTMVNWACCLKPPPEVRQAWAKDFGVDHFVSEAFDASVEAIWKRIGVQSGDAISHNRANQLMMEGCKKLGYEVKATGQNMADTGPLPPGAGFINNGDRHGLKQSMPETYLRDAATAATPAQFLDGCYVDRVLHQSGSVVGVKARVTDVTGAQHTVTVRAPIVVVSGGSLHSPALLLRSELPNRNGQIGKNLHLHPVCGVMGMMPHEVDTFKGAPMTSVHTTPTEDGHGCKIEVPCLHAGLLSSLLPWVDGKQFKADLLDAKKMCPLIALLKDKTTGEVRIDKEGHVHIHYPISNHTENALVEGIARAFRVLEAAGAERIYSSQLPNIVKLPPPTDAKARAVALEDVIAQVRSVGLQAGKVMTFSAHQMGSCRMSSNPKESVVGPNCESWEVEGLYVVDASTFPTASGVNPMITTLAIAHYAAQGLKTRLAEASKA